MTDAVADAPKRRRGRPRKDGSAPSAATNHNPPEATASAPRAAAKAIHQAKTLPAEIRVKFGQVSIGAKTARVGISFSREYLALGLAAELFVDRRLIGKISVVRPDEESRQMTFLPDDRPIINSAFDVSQFSVHADNYTTGLTMRRQSVDMATLAEFGSQSGVLRIESAGEITDAPDAEEHEIDDHDEDSEA